MGDRAVDKKRGSVGLANECSTNKKVNRFSAPGYQTLVPCESMICARLITPYQWDALVTDRSFAKLSFDGLSGRSTDHKIHHDLAAGGWDLGAISQTRFRLSRVRNERQVGGRAVCPPTRPKHHLIREKAHPVNQWDQCPIDNFYQIDRLSQYELRSPMG
jgi:hypothetical protein